MKKPHTQFSQKPPRPAGNGRTMGMVFAGLLVLMARPTRDGHAANAAGQPPPGRAALLAFVQEPLRFESFCFSGDTFPPCRFEHPERVEKLIGTYTLKTIWYDTQGKVVTAPHKAAGRYAAVVEIHRPGRVSKRFFTLYHLQGKARGLVRAAGATMMLPREAAIDPGVVQSQREEVDDLVTRALSDALKKDPAGAALLAGLHDLTERQRAGKAIPDDHGGDRERQWWVDFRRRYYGFDKRYPEAFVCPRPLRGKPAPLVPPGTLAEAGMKADARARIDAACAAWLKENLNGFGLCVVRRGVLVVNQGYGQVDGKAVTDLTAAVLASLTKFLNAILLLEMIDQGRLDLNDPIDKHLPAVRGIAVRRPMTIRDLYLHTCGFTGHEGDTWPDLEEVVADLYPALEVGVRHQYQGMGHALASKIMENMSGEALPYLYQNHLFRPLGCTHSRADRSSYGSRSIPLELARIGQMMLNGGSYGDRYFFSPKTLAQMLPVPGQDRIGPDKSIRWGVGIKQQDSEGLSARVFGHSGATGSFMVIDPEHQLVIAHTRMTEGKSYTEFLKQKARVIAAIVAAIDKEK
jgi:CubicO group peptidase (beta-lactamase class C family)